MSYRTDKKTMIGRAITINMIYINDNIKKKEERQQKK